MAEKVGVTAERIEAFNEDHLDECAHLFLTAFSARVGRKAKKIEAPATFRPGKSKG